MTSRVTIFIELKGEKSGKIEKNPQKVKLPRCGTCESIHLEGSSTKSCTTIHTWRSKTQDLTLKKKRSSLLGGFKSPSWPEEPDSTPAFTVR